MLTPLCWFVIFTCCLFLASVVSVLTSIGGPKGEPLGVDYYSTC